MKKPAIISDTSSSEISLSQNSISTHTPAFHTSKTSSFLKDIFPASLENNVIYCIICILTALSAGYLFRLSILPDATYKYLSITLICGGILAFPFTRQLRGLGLLFLSLSILLFECNTIIKAPFIIHLSEAGIKFLSPIAILLLFTSRKELAAQILTISIVLTYTSHGLLALNVLPTPEFFYAMTGKILHLDATMSGIFLKTAGFLDIAACLFILTKPKGYKYAIFYCIAWGFITAFARTLFVSDSNASTIIMTLLTETLTRIPNAVAPLLLLILLNKKKPIK